MSILRRSMVAGGTLAVLAAVEWRQSRAAGEVPFNALRIAMNRRVNPWLLRLGFVGGGHSEIASIEHVGRVSRTVRLTPVHPTFVDEHVWIPLPYGETSQWARNVIAAGHCRLQLRGTVYELDEPQIVAAPEDPKLSRPAARLAAWLGIGYLRLHRFAEGPVETTLEPSQAPPTAELAPTA